MEIRSRLRRMRAYGSYAQGYTVNFFGRLTQDPLLAATGAMRCVQAGLQIRRGRENPGTLALLGAKENRPPPLQLVVNR